MEVGNIANGTTTFFASLCTTRTGFNVKQLADVALLIHLLFINRDER